MLTTESRMEDFRALQREYRHMELNRKAYAYESHQLMCKQQANIERLRRENEGLKASVAAEMRQRMRPLSKAQNHRVVQLQEEAGGYVDANEREKRGIAVLTEQIGLVRRKILHRRKATGGVNAARENHYMVQKQTRILEGRLDKALVKFNEVLARNKTLRREIDDLRRERVVFDGIYRKLERDLAEKKRQMARVIELSNLSYEQRDGFQLETAAVQQADRKEQQDFEDQVAALDDRMAADLSLGAPQRERKRSDSGRQDGAPDAPRDSGATDGAIDGAPAADEATRLREQVSAVQEQLLRHQDDAHTSMARVRHFEDAFNRIRAATGIQDVDELVRTFIKNEDHNFSLFNYVNEQTNEIEKLEEQIQALREEETRYAQESGDDATQHRAALGVLEARLQATEATAQKYEQKCAAAQSTQDGLKRGIQSCFRRLECKHAAGAASESAMTEATMLGLLGACEQRANEIIQAYAFVTRRDRAPATHLPALAGGLAQECTQEGSVVRMLGSGPATPMGHDPIQVNPPKLEDYSDAEFDDNGEEDDDDTRPLTHDELKASTLSSISKRGNAARARRGK